MVGKTRIEEGNAMLEHKLRFGAFGEPICPEEGHPTSAPRFQQLNVHRDAWMEWVRRNKQGDGAHARAAASGRVAWDAAVSQVTAAACPTPSPSSAAE
jgi:hypothetical protein